MSSIFSGLQNLDQTPHSPAAALLLRYFVNHGLHVAISTNVIVTEKGSVFVPQNLCKSNMNSVSPIRTPRISLLLSSVMPDTVKAARLTTRSSSRLLKNRASEFFGPKHVSEGEGHPHLTFHAAAAGKRRGAALVADVAIAPDDAGELRIA